MNYVSLGKGAMELMESYLKSEKPYDVSVSGVLIGMLVFILAGLFITHIMDEWSAGDRKNILNMNGLLKTLRAICWISSRKMSK